MPPPATAGRRDTAARHSNTAVNSTANPRKQPSKIQSSAVSNTTAVMPSPKHSGGSLVHVPVLHVIVTDRDRVSSDADAVPLHGAHSDAMND